MDPTTRMIPILLTLCCAVRGNPLEDVHVLEAPVWVMKGGQVAQ